MPQMADQKKSATVSFVTTPEIQEALRKASQEHDRSLSWLIGKALEAFLAKEGYLKRPKSSER